MPSGRKRREITISYWVGRERITTGPSSLAEARSVVRELRAHGHVPEAVNGEGRPVPISEFLVRTPSRQSLSPASTPCNAPRSFRT